MTDALKVALDALREALGECDVVRWVEHPDAVRELLRLSPATGEEYVCQVCEADDDTPHLRTCPIADAWRTLGDPRGADDIERAHVAALHQDRTRIFGVQPSTYEQWRAPLANPNVKEGQVIAFSPEDFRLAAMRPAVTTLESVTCNRCGDPMDFDGESTWFCAHCPRVPPDKCGDFIPYGPSCVLEADHAGEHVYHR